MDSIILGIHESTSTPYIKLRGTHILTKSSDRHGPNKAMSLSAQF